MAAYRETKPNFTRAIALVKRVKELANELIVAVSQDDRLNKYRFDSAITERAKIVDCMKKRYLTAAGESETVNEQLDCARKKLNELNILYEGVVNENRGLRSMVLSLKEEPNLQENDLQECSECRLKLQLFKKMIGVHFDINSLDEEITGFVAIKGDAQHLTTFVPFILSKNERNIGSYLWNKIGEGLQSLTDNCSTMVPQDISVSKQSN